MIQLELSNSLNLQAYTASVESKVHCGLSLSQSRRQRATLEAQIVSQNVIRHGRPDVMC